MRNVVSRAFHGGLKAKYLVSAAAAVMLAACSNSVERFAENPSDQDPVYTASVQKKKVAASYEASAEDTITSKPLANASVQQPNYSYDSAYQKPAYKQPAYSYNKPKYNATQPSYAAEPEVAEAPAAPVYKKAATVRVEPGMTLYSIAKANGMTVAQLADANNIPPPYTVSAGRVLKIPGRTTAQAPAPRMTQSQTASATEAPATPVKTKASGTHTVASGETLFSLGRKYGVSPYAIADLNGLPRNTSLGIGQKVRIPGGGSSPVIAKSQKQAQPSEEVIADNDSSSGEEAIGEQTAQNVPAAKPKPQPEPQQLADANPALGVGTMRWPVKGKVISAFGPKNNGLKNEGINIAVPEGTGIRAAESGVVAYAGNELKGYGNLVLIRHTGGWVTAYAHAKELFVKRGDTVKRGDVIAKAGQTGSVTSPQLHFEVRKGATAMDPMKFLGSTTAMN